MYLFIDVETTGLPKSRYLDYTYLDNFENSRMVQFTMLLCDEHFDMIECKDYIIKLDGLTIPNSELHGITEEISATQGIPFEEVANEFKDILDKTTYIIAHNISFDMSIIKSELYRRGNNDMIILLNSKKTLCTMIHTKKMVNIKSEYGLKYPSLPELYKYLFQEDMKHHHNSKYDVLNLHKIVKHLYDNKKIRF